MGLRDSRDVGADGVRPRAHTVCPYMTGRTF